MLEKKSIVSVKCSDIMSDQNVKLAGHIQNLVGQCPMTDSYFQLWTGIRHTDTQWKAEGREGREQKLLKRST